MTQMIHAVYQDGVFRPIGPVNLPNHCEVEVEVRQITPQPPLAPMSEGLRKVYAILGERYNSGQHDTAARHNEHQP